jgi:Protein of unknown function, DUF488
MADKGEQARMLNRQKAILQLFKLADQPLDRSKLNSFAYLVKTTTASKGGETFYDFLSDGDQLFSFTLDQEVAKLQQHGYLSDDGTSGLRLESQAIPAVSKALLDDLKMIAQPGATSRFSAEQVAQQVSTHDSKRAQRSVYGDDDRRTHSTIFTCGYEGKTVEAFLDMLLRAKVQTILDVRRNPIARRFGFHKSTLSRLAAQVGIRYLHFPDLGVPSEFRQNLVTEQDYARLFRYYANSVLAEQEAAIDELCQTVNQSSSSLLCKEADPTCCHRSVLAKHLSKRLNMRVSHLS